MFESRKASRGGVKPLISFYSESGAGKSFSALMLARGFVGPSGNIQLVDTESGRGELYSDVIPGGYNVIPFTEPFSPARYVEAARYAESLKADIIIFDQMSSEWDGVGGVLDLAAENENKGNRGLSVWKTPKMEHAKMMVRLLQSPCPILICLRAKYKSRQVKQNGKTEIIKDETLTPIQDDAFIFESTIHGYISLDHHFHITKHSHPDLLQCFPNNAPITLEHGKLLAQWCAGTKAQPPSQPPSNLVALKRKLFEATKEKHGGNKNALEQWLWDEMILGDAEHLADLTADRLADVVKDADRKLRAQQEVGVMP